MLNNLSDDKKQFVLTGVCAFVITGAGYYVYNKYNLTSTVKKCVKESYDKLNYILGSESLEDMVTPNPEMTTDLPDNYYGYNDSVNELVDEDKPEVFGEDRELQKTPEPDYLDDEEECEQFD